VNNDSEKRNGKEHQMKRMKQIFSLAVGMCLAGMAPLCELRAAEGGQTNITVEVLIFSGRPNPTWQLEDTNQLPVLKAKLKDLPKAFDKEPAEWSRLGFGGFLIHGGEAVGLPGEIRIYQGVIKAGHGNQTKYLKDLDGVEQRLLDEARKQSLAPPVKDALAHYENERKKAQ
jgi:hypothetical protein